MTDTKYGFMDFAGPLTTTSSAATQLVRFVEAFPVDKLVMLGEAKNANGRHVTTETRQSERAALAADFVSQTTFQAANICATRLGEAVKRLSM